MMKITLEIIKCPTDDGCYDLIITDTGENVYHGESYNEVRLWLLKFLGYPESLLDVELAS